MERIAITRSWWWIELAMCRASSAVDENRAKTGIAQNAAGVALFRGPMACRLVDRTGKVAALDVSVEAKSDEGQGQASRSERRTSPSVLVSWLGHFVATMDGHLTGGEWPQPAGVHLPSWLAARWGMLEAGLPCTVVSETTQFSLERGSIGLCAPSNSKQAAS